MAYDLEEQEQLDELKAWWKRFGHPLLLAVAAALLTVAAYQAWRHYTLSQSVEAVTLFEQMEQADRSDEHKKVRDIAAQIVDKYGRTPYAAMAALASARAALESRDLPAAKVQLRWVMENAREDASKDIARLRLAGILLDEGSHDEALKELQSQPHESMTGLYADLRGDILAAQGKPAEARSAYQSALDKSESGSPYRATIQLKLDSLGDK